MPIPVNQQNQRRERDLPELDVPPTPESLTENGQPGQARPNVAGARGAGQRDPEALSAIFGNVAPTASPARQPPPLSIKPGQWRTVSDLKLATKTAKKYETQTETYPGSQEIAKDLQEATWGRVADFVGIHLDLLVAFNPEIADKLADPLGTPEAGARLYVPTSAQILFMQTCASHGIEATAQEIRDNPQAVAARAPEVASAYEGLGKRQKVVEAARDRDAGETGDAYATFSDAFYTRNAGLTSRASKEKIDGQSERVAAWGASWKCNVFVNDSLHQAGLSTPVMSNKHYATAGRMYENYTQKEGEPAKRGQLFEEISYDAIQPGDVFVRYGGTGEASSHTEVITGKASAHTFYASGAHMEGAYERRYITDSKVYEEARRELVKQHLRAQGKNPDEMSAEELAAHVMTLGEQLLKAAHVQYLDASSYNFMRHKQIGS